MYICEVGMGFQFTSLHLTEGNNFPEDFIGRVSLLKTLAAGNPIIFHEKYSPVRKHVLTLFLWETPGEEGFQILRD